MVKLCSLCMDENPQNQIYEYRVDVSQILHDAAGRKNVIVIGKFKGAMSWVFWRFYVT